MCFQSFEKISKSTLWLSFWNSNGNKWKEYKETENVYAVVKSSYKCACQLNSCGCTQKYPLVPSIQMIWKHFESFSEIHLAYNLGYIV